jgi:hypothetical protein
MQPDGEHAWRDSCGSLNRPPMLNNSPAPPSSFQRATTRIPACPHEDHHDTESSETAPGPTSFDPQEPFSQPAKPGSHHAPLFRLAHLSATLCDLPPFSLQFGAPLDVVQVGPADRSEKDAGSKTGRLVAGPFTQSTDTSDQAQGERRDVTAKLAAGSLDSHWLAREGKDARKERRLVVAQTDVYGDRPPPTVWRNGGVVSRFFVAGKKAISKVEREKIVSTLPSKCRFVQPAWLVDHPPYSDAPSPLLMHGKFLALAPHRLALAVRGKLWPSTQQCSGRTPCPRARMRKSRPANCRTRTGNYLYVHVTRWRSKDTVVSSDLRTTSCA